MFTYNLRIYRGTLFSERFVWTENLVPINLTGWQAKAQIKNATTGVAYVLSTDAGTIALGSAGEIDLVLDAQATIEMIPNSYAWDLLLKNPQGDILPPFISGVATVLQGVTTW
jgi:hypothetical protein